jgi:antitoxin (DNA-binding transcriptional repressor) of toxin-antitoxin stability system
MHRTPVRIILALYTHSCYTIGTQKHSLKKEVSMKKVEKREQLDVQELKERIDELLRLVKEKGEIIEVTEKGKVIARLVPTTDPKQSSTKSDDPAWDALKRIAEELDPYWPKDVDAVEAVRDVRRDL